MIQLTDTLAKPNICNVTEVVKNICAIKATAKLSGFPFCEFLIRI